MYVALVDLQSRKIRQCLRQNKGALTGNLQGLYFMPSAPSCANNILLTHVVFFNQPMHVCSDKGSKISPSKARRQMSQEYCRQKNCVSQMCQLCLEMSTIKDSLKKQVAPCSCHDDDIQILGKTLSFITISGLFLGFLVSFSACFLKYTSSFVEFNF